MGKRKKKFIMPEADRFRPGVLRQTNGYIVSDAIRWGLPKAVLLYSLRYATDWAAGMNNGDPRIRLSAAGIQRQNPFMTSGSIKQWLRSLVKKGVLEVADEPLYSDPLNHTKTYGRVAEVTDGQDTNHFRITDAVAYGMQKAVVLNHFRQWIGSNQKNNKGNCAGIWWAYQTAEQIRTHHPYLGSHNTISNYIKELIDDDVLVQRYENAGNRMIRWITITGEFGLGNKPKTKSFPRGKNREYEGKNAVVRWEENDNYNIEVNLEKESSKNAASGVLEKEEQITKEDTEGGMLKESYGSPTSGGVVRVPKGGMSRAIKESFNTADEAIEHDTAALTRRGVALRQSSLVPKQTELSHKWKDCMLMHYPDSSNSVLTSTEAATLYRFAMRFCRQDDVSKKAGLPPKPVSDFIDYLESVITQWPSLYAKCFSHLGKSSPHPDISLITGKTSSGMLMRAIASTIDVSKFEGMTDREIYEHKLVERGVDKTKAKVLSGKKYGTKEINVLDDVTKALDKYNIKLQGDVSTQFDRERIREARSQLVEHLARLDELAGDKIGDLEKEPDRPLRKGRSYRRSISSAALENFSNDDNHEQEEGE